MGLNYDEIKQKIKYYDFEFSDADKLFLFVKTSNWIDYVYIQIPESYKLYEASYFHYAYDLDDSKLKIDGKTVSDLPYCEYCWKRAFGLYNEEDFSVGQPHTLEIYYDCEHGIGSAGFATVLIYKSPWV